MTREDWADVAKEIADATREYVALQVGPLQRQVDEWKEARAIDRERIKSLETRPAVPYRGVWDATVDYTKGDSATFGGSMWHANRESRGRRPSEAPDAWTLCVKRGSDASR